MRRMVWDAAKFWWSQDHYHTVSHEGHYSQTDILPPNLRCQRPGAQSSHCQRQSAAARVQSNESVSHGQGPHVQHWLAEVMPRHQSVAWRLGRLQCFALRLGHRGKAAVIVRYFTTQTTHASHIVTSVQEPALPETLSFMFFVAVAVWKAASSEAQAFQYFRYNMARSSSCAWSTKSSPKPEAVGSREVEVRVGVGEVKAGIVSTRASARCCSILVVLACKGAE